MADKYVMLVEGPDDYHVLQHLLTVHGIDQTIKYRLQGYRPAVAADNEIVFHASEGVQNVFDNLSQRLKITGELACIGVIVDADLSIAGRWQRLRDILIGSGYADVPKVPNAGGTLVEHEEKPRVGIWIMPNNTLPGKVEDFIALLVPPGDALWTQAERNVQEILEAERRFNSEAFIKAHIHTWLAWQERPGLPMGSAIREKYLNVDAPEALLLIDWLRRLFDLRL